jgi:hypothetical protein
MEEDGSEIVRGGSEGAQAASGFGNDPGRKAATGFERSLVGGATSTEGREEVTEKAATSGGSGVMSIEALVEGQSRHRE